MKVLTLTQPWASAIALGNKRVETRSWPTHYRGDLLIHAAIGMPKYARQFAGEELAAGRSLEFLPLGAIVAIARVADVRPADEVALEVSGLERLYGDYSSGRWAWMLEDIRALAEPVPARGSLGFWRPSPDVEAAVAQQLFDAL